jgi:elongation factor Ts
MPGIDGLQLLQQLQEQDPELPVLLITGHGDVPLAVQAMRTGAYDFLEKPFASDDLLDSVRRALAVRRLVLVRAPTVVGSYVHTDHKKAALVAVEGGDAELARDLAMQVVAASPRYLTPADAPADLVAKEREIETEKAKGEEANAKKPPDILAKIVEGRLRKSINEFALTGQVFVKDGDLTIEKLLQKSKATVKAFERVEVGAGIEKKQGDFANEVMEQVKAATKKDDKSDPPTKH